VSTAVTIYTLRQCSTCKDATRWLRAHGVDFIEKPIRETPPTLPELRTVLAGQGGEIRRLFNSSGIEYRALKMAEKLPKLTEAQALETLAGNGHLVKRPFVVGKGVTLLGFDPERWAAAFRKK